MKREQVAQEPWKQVFVRQTPDGDFLPRDVCVRTDVPPQQLARQLENMTRTMIGECYRWHALADENCFFEDQKASLFHEKAQALFRAQAIFRRQAKAPQTHLLTGEERQVLVKAKQIECDLLPSFGLWKTVEHAQSTWTDGLPTDALSAAYVAVTSLFTRFMERVAPVPPRTITSSQIEAPAPERQHS
ncbi:MAG: hypothetical protein ILP11_02415 [Alphaproteobacteria bacterium]|nr:hypothetical protein [Alphaproteobacteria bacterium]